MSLDIRFEAKKVMRGKERDTFGPYKSADTMKAAQLLLTQGHFFIQSGNNKAELFVHIR